LRALLHEQARRICVSSSEWITREEHSPAKPVSKPRGLPIHVLVCVTNRVTSFMSIINRSTSSTLIDFYMLSMIWLHGNHSHPIHANSFWNPPTDRWRIGQCFSFLSSFLWGFQDLGLRRRCVRRPLVHWYPQWIHSHAIIDSTHQSRSHRSFVLLSTEDWFVSFNQNVDEGEAPAEWTDTRANGTGIQSERQIRLISATSIHPGTSTVSPMQHRPLLFHLGQQPMKMINGLVDHQ